MFTSNPFAELSASIPPTIMQTYIVVMVVLVVGGTLYETWHKMTSMIQTGLDISPIITHRFRAQLFEERFEILRSGKFRKGHS